MRQAYSRLKSVLEAEKLTTAELVRRIADSGARINPKSIYRLADPQEPLEKVDMRVISVVCDALGVGIGDLLTFDEPTIVEQFDPVKQSRLDALLARRDTLAPDEHIELRELVRAAEEVARGNARRLQAHLRRLQRAPRPPANPPSQAYAVSRS